ncbi:MAG: manganese efflux pump [Clostridiales bacterium]|jgi:putative Mn2+ efflux pump MntP|nr:manganese efflux pump [Clostridiales bacterium]
MTGILPLLLLAVGLSMDAFAVSICKGLSAKTADFKKFAFTAAVFGGLQGIMPIIGYVFGSIFIEYIEDYLGIVSFVILLVVGAKMIYEGGVSLRTQGNPESENKESLKTEKRISGGIGEQAGAKSVKTESQENPGTGNQVSAESVKQGNFGMKSRIGAEAGEQKDSGIGEQAGAESVKTERQGNPETGKQISRTVGDQENSAKNGGFSVKEIFVQGIATSIDALAVGVSLLNFSIPIAASAAVIASVTFCICFFGVFLGHKFGLVLKTKDAYADIIGGIILLGIGIGFLF